MERFKRIRQKWYRKWEICCGYFVVVVVCCVHSFVGPEYMHLAKSKRIVWIGKQMKMKRNVHTRTRKRVRENRKEENKNIKRSSEWEKEKAIAWMDWATANNVNNFISSLFLSPSLMPKKIERVSHLFMLLLCDLLVYFFRLSPFFSLFHFYSLLLFLPIWCRDFYFSSPFIMRIPFGHSHICC